MRHKNITLRVSVLAILSLLALGTTKQVSAEIAQAPQHINIKGVFKEANNSNSQILNDGVVQVTPDAKYQKGAIWSQDGYKMDLTYDFHSKMYINLGDKNGKAGDGMAFVMMNDPDKVQTWNQETGASLGVWRSPKISKSDATAIKKSFAVEFDTYYNPLDLDGLRNSVDDNEQDADMPSLLDRKRGHIAYGFPGRTDAYKKVDLINYGLIHHNLQIPTADNYLSNGSWHPFTIDWDSTNHILTYQLDSLLQQRVKLDPSVFETDHVYWGFTGATGDNSELNQIIFAEVPGLNDIDSPATLKGQRDNIISSIETGKPGSQGIPAYVGKTVHYTIKPTDLVTSKADVNNLEADIQLDHTTYKQGTLKINGQKPEIDDSQWKKQLSVPLESLTHTEPTKQIEFDAIVDPLSKDIAPATAVDKIAYKSDLLLDKQFELPYTVQLDGIHVTNPLPDGSYQLTSAAVAKLRTLASSDEVAQELAKMTGMTADRKSDGATVDLDKFKTTEDALGLMRNLKANSSVTLHFQAPDMGLPSDTATCVLIAPKDDGELKIDTIEQNSTFQTVKIGNPAEVSMHSGKWNVTVSDTRAYGSKWQLSLALSQPFKTADGLHTLKGDLEYLKADGGAFNITDTPTEIASGANTTNATTTITDQWTNKTGLALKHISSHNYAGNYSGELTWTLSDVPK